MTANSNKSKQGNKAAHRVIAGVLCGASVLSLVLSLVMPPISQAIANDAQTVYTEKTVMGGGSSSESTDVDNTTNGDTENQNSDEVEGGESGDDVQPEEQFEDALQAEDNIAPTVETVAAVAENEKTVSAAEEIANADELCNKLQGVQAGQTASFKLIQNIVYDGEISLSMDHSNITLDLNGFKIKHSGDNNNLPLFSVSGGASLSIKDCGQATDNKWKQDGDERGVLASVSHNGDDGTPLKLTYYVTESSVNAEDNTRTTETTYKHEVDIAGAIVGTTAAPSMKLINVYAGGTFNLQSGVLTTNKGCNVSNLIYAENGSTVNISGGYVCGASKGSSGAGAGIHVEGSTLEISGGVIAGNYAPSGGGVYAMNSTVNMVGGIISGNGTNKDQRGYGAGICAENSSVTITNGYITNNKYQFYLNEESDWKHLGNGCHGGGGIAAWNGGSLTIAGGYITGNYSAEAGGGVYAGAWNSALSGFTFSGGTIASNVAQNSEGGGIRIAAPTVGDFNVSDKKAYITNNTTNTTNDWGGGGVFVQGSSDQGIKSASLNIYNALITNNHANGFGGGFAACPTGKTAITDTNGIAIFGNSDGRPDGSGYNRSGGTHDKNDDADWRPNREGGEITEDFKKAGHQDLFLIRDSANAESLSYIAAVTGQMLGGGAANWSGTIDNNTRTSIGKYEGAQAKYMIGLKSEPIKEDKDAATAAATLYITGNKSNIHGGGIMTNGDVVAGSTTQVKVYPKMKLNGTKELTGRTLKEGEFNFQLLKQGADKKAPSFGSDGTLQPNGCSVVGTVKNDVNGNFAFNLSEVYADDDLVYYLVEVPGADKDVNYDKTIYKIDPTVTEDGTRTHEVLGIKYTYYTVSNVKITKMSDGATETVVTPTSEDGVACVALTNGATFTNKYTLYTSSGSWTPKATKVVEGGEMKEFTLQLATDVNFQDIIREANTTGDKKNQTLSFVDDSGKGIGYSLSDITKDPDTADDSTGRGASKTFTYYVREKNESSIFSHYKFDQSVYKFTVVATDDTNRAIDCQVTYRKGTVDSDGKWKDADNADHDLTDTDTPTFTNTYSTTLPLSGMSGVTLTYLAGAAVLCAAAAWMHIRRKANAKGGERRE